MVGKSTELIRDKEVVSLQLCVDTAMTTKPFSFRSQSTDHVIGFTDHFNGNLLRVEAVGADQVVYRRFCSSVPNSKKKYDT